MACKPRLQHKLLSSVTLLTGGSLAFVGINVYNGNADFYKNLLMPTVHRLFDPETAHQMAIKFAKYKCIPKVNDSTLPPHLAKLLETEMWGKKFTNPLGLAAGFDKDGEALSGLTQMGFGFIEIGSVTPQPQDGNEKPRVFRLIQDKGIINRYGFNSSGHEVVKRNLEKFWLRGEGKPSTVHIGVNLGKNKTSSENSDDDYLQGLRLFSQDKRITYFVINISSPNTPGLRRMQNRDQFNRLLDSIEPLKLSGEIYHPVLIKISPDLTYEEREDIAKSIVMKNKQHPPVNIVDGIVVSNTTVTRPKYLKETDQQTIQQSGGLSGAPIKSLSTQAIHDMYKLTHGQVPIIGVGGVFSGQDAIEKIKAGASLIQLYTSFTLEGPPIIASIKEEMANILSEQKFNSIVEAVGADHRK